MKQQLPIQAARAGTPIMRPLFFDFHDDPGSTEVDDQMMFGYYYLLFSTYCVHT